MEGARGTRAKPRGQCVTVAGAVGGRAINLCCYCCVERAEAATGSPILPLLAAKAGLSVKPQVARAPEEDPLPALGDGELVLWLQTLSLYWLPGQQGGRAGS